MTQHIPLSPQESDAVASALGGLSAQSQFEISLDALLDRWTAFVSAVESEYNDSIYEYENDLGARDALEQVMRVAPPSLQAKLSSVLEPLDARFKEATIDRPDEDVAAQRWWSPRIPRQPGPELAADIGSL